MQSSELELYATSELISELMRRQTFQGVIVHGEHDRRNEAWDGSRNFKVHTNANLPALEASRLLARISDHLFVQECE